MNRFLCVFLLLSFLAGAQAQKQQVTLLFAGDAMQHLPQIKAAYNGAGYEYDSCFYRIKEKIDSTDIACVNLETVLAGKPYTGYPAFSAPDAFAEALKNTGFDVFFLANNHALDKGQKGLERTIDVLDSLGVKHTGTFKSPEARERYYPLMIIKNGIRIAFLNYVYGTNGLSVRPPNVINLIDTMQIKKDLALTDLYRPDIIIANMHWGEEYKTLPSVQQKQLAEFLFLHGVRIVIGHHPHVVQPMVLEREGESIKHVVYYSMGNFISNQQKVHTDGGMLAEVVISKEDDDSPVRIESCDYSLVWVRKFFQNGKYRYVLLPSWKNQEDLTPEMTQEEKQKMNTFVTHAERIIRPEK